MRIPELVKYVTISAIFTILSVVAAKGAGYPAIRQDSLPMYVRIIDDVNDINQTSISDSLFYEIAGKTIFRVNKTYLNLKDPFLRELADEVLPYANANNLSLVGIRLTGAASPEGPYNNNVRLSVGRADALRRFLTEHLDSVALDQFVTTTVAEDYAQLLRVMDAKNDPDTWIVRGIVDDCGLDNPAQIKQRLRRYDKGRLWQRLLRNIYPDLRAARVVLFFQPYTPGSDTPKKPVIVEIDLQDIFMPLEVEIPPAPLYKRISAEYRMERPHMLSVSSNLLYDVFYMPQYGWAPMPNINVEFYPLNSPWTVRAGFMFPYYHKWSKHKFFQIRDYHLEVRRYLNPGFWHTGTYLSAYVNATKYGIGLSDTKGWQGEGIGAALKVGHVLPLGDKRWRLDLHVAFGGWMSRYDPYVYGNPITGEQNGDFYYDWTQSAESFKRRNHRFTWFGPTELGVTLTFDVLYHKRPYKPSFNRYETIFF